MTKASPTDQRTDRRTDRPSYRDARTHLKTRYAAAEAIETAELAQATEAAEAEAEVVDLVADLHIEVFVNFEISGATIKTWIERIHER